MSRVFSRSGTRFFFFVVDICERKSRCDFEEESKPESKENVEREREKKMNQSLMNMWVNEETSKL